MVIVPVQELLLACLVPPASLRVKGHVVTIMRDEYCIKNKGKIKTHLEAFEGSFAAIYQWLILKNTTEEIFNHN